MKGLIMLFKKMLPKALIIICCSAFFIGIAQIAYRNMSILNQKNTQLLKKLDAFENKEIRLETMKKTLMVCYNLTPYEARYYSFIFDDFSQQYKLPWQAYPAIIRIESNFNPGVMSKERAKGIAQVMEATGRGQAEKLNIPFDDGTLWNSILNMVIGLDYFSEGYAAKVDSIPADSALKHAMKRYCGGPNYFRLNDSARIYVREYKTTVWDEYERIRYVYKGLLYDQLTMLGGMQDTIKTNISWIKSLFFKRNS